MNVDSLVLTLGIDPAELVAGLRTVNQLLDGLLSVACDFAAGLSQGFQDAAGGVDAAASQMEAQAESGGRAIEKNLTGKIRDAGREAEAAAASVAKIGGEARNAGQKGASGMAQLAAKTKEAESQAQGTSSKLKALGARWGGFLGGIAASVVGPLAGAMGAGALMGSYFSDVAQMAEQTGRYTKQMEEAYRKKALLARINREDIELYRKGKLALLDFNKSMGDLSAEIMRAFGPAIGFGIEWLGKFSAWIGDNKGNILRFFTILATIVTIRLIPAFKKWALTILANPLVGIIAGIMALALVIDDLITYIQGGESAFADFWALLGTGEELSAVLGAAWETLKEIGLGVFEALKAAVKFFYDSFKNTFDSLFGIVQGVVNLIKAIFKGDWAGAGKALMDTFRNALEFVKQIFTSIWNIAGKVLSWLKDKIVGLLPNWVKKLLGLGGGDSDGEKPFAAPEPPDPNDDRAMKKYLEDNGVLESEMPSRFKTQAETAPPSLQSVMPPEVNITQVVQPAQVYTQQAVPPAANIKTENNTSFEVQNNLTVNATGIDPGNITAAAQSALEQSNGKLGVLASETGVRQ